MILNVFSEHNIHKFSSWNFSHFRKLTTKRTKKPYKCLCADSVTHPGIGPDIVTRGHWSTTTLWSATRLDNRLWALRMSFVAIGRTFDAPITIDTPPTRVTQEPWVKATNGGAETGLAFCRADDFLDQQSAQEGRLFMNKWRRNCYWRMLRSGRWVFGEELKKLTSSCYYNVIVLRL